MRVRSFIVAGSMLALLTVIAGCGGGSDSASGTSLPTTALAGALTTTRGAVTGTRPAPTSRAAGGGSAAVPRRRSAPN